MEEKKVIDAKAENVEAAPKRKLSFKRVAMVFGIAILIIGIALCLIFDISIEKIKYHFTKENPYSEEGTFIEGIPFSEVIDKMSAKNIEFEGKIVSESKSDKNVEIKNGNLKVTYSLKDGEAIIFDRAGLKKKKTPDDFIIGGYTTENVSRSNKDSNVIYCEDAETVSRVLRYNCNTDEMVLLWSNDIISDKYLPIAAIKNVFEFEKSDRMIRAIDPEYDEPLYDPRKVILKETIEGEENVIHISFSETINANLVVIIQDDSSNTYVISANYIDDVITTSECEKKYEFKTTSSIERILVYDYENALIQLVYEKE